MTKSNIVTGLAIKVIERHDNELHPRVTTGYDTMFINVNPRNILDLDCYNRNKPWTTLFEYTFYETCNIALYFLVKFRFDPNNYGLRRLQPIQFVRYDTHEYDIASVLGKSNDGQRLLLFGDKLGEINYDISNTDFPYKDFIRDDDKLLIKFPSRIGQFIQIIDNVSTQERKWNLKHTEWYRAGWARDDFLPQKYQFSPTGILLQNKRQKEN